MNDTDQDAVKAAVDLVGRAGAVNLEVGYLHEDVPTDEAGWYAHAQFRGARVIVEDRPGPTEAVEALARRLLSAGAQCRWCGREVALSDFRAAGRCRWSRDGDRWERGCADTHTTSPTLEVPGWARAGAR